jgi:hypothetical protein
MFWPLIENNKKYTKIRNKKLATTPLKIINVYSNQIRTILSQNYICKNILNVYSNQVRDILKFIILFCLVYYNKEKKRIFHYSTFFFYNNYHSTLLPSKAVKKKNFYWKSDSFQSVYGPFLQKLTWRCCHNCFWQ